MNSDFGSISAEQLSAITAEQREEQAQLYRRSTREIKKQKYQEFFEAAKAAARGELRV